MDICKNSATCIPKSNGSVSCICTAEFTGPICEVSICTNINCSGNGVCSPDINEIYKEK